MTAPRYGIYTAAFDSLTLDQISGVTVSPAVQQLIATPGGTLDPALIGTALANPLVEVRTTDIKKVLDACSVSSALGISTAAEVQFQKRASCSTFASGSNHLTINATKGCLFVNSITASQASVTGAELSFSFLAEWDGTNLPLVVNDSQALANAPAHNQTYYLGPVAINGSQLEGVTAVTINTGIAMQSFTADGDPYPRTGSASIISRNPEIQLTILKTNYVATSALFGYALPGAIDCYFWKAVNATDRVAKATSGHIKISAATGVVTPQSVTVAGFDDATVTLSIKPNTTLSQNTASAISV